jgi:hypothetical protein
MEYFAGIDVSLEVLASVPNWSLSAISAESLECPVIPHHDHRLALFDYVVSAPL